MSDLNEAVVLDWLRRNPKPAARILDSYIIRPYHEKGQRKLLYRNLIELSSFAATDLLGEALDRLGWAEENKGRYDDE